MNKPIPPLSPAAQAVLDAAEQVPVPHGLVFSLIHLEIAAAIRALVEQTLPAERPTHTLQQTQRQHTRTQQLAIAAELDGGAPQPTSTENPQ